MSDSNAIADTRLRTKQAIKEWHFHVYWREQQMEAAVQLRDALLEEVQAHASFIVVCEGATPAIIPGLRDQPPPMNHRAVGPHATCSFETWVPNESLAHALSWFTLHRGALSVLVHPLTRYERDDHSVHAMWLGPPQKLDLEVLSADRGTPPKQYPELALGYSSNSPVV